MNFRTSQIIEKVLLSHIKLKVETKCRKMSLLNGKYFLLYWASAIKHFHGKHQQTLLIKANGVLN